MEYKFQMASLVHLKIRCIIVTDKNHIAVTALTMSPTQSSISSLTSLRTNGSVPTELAGCSEDMLTSALMTWPLSKPAQCPKSISNSSSIKESFDGKHQICSRCNMQSDLSSIIFYWNMPVKRDRHLIKSAFKYSSRTRVGQ